MTAAPSGEVRVIRARIFLLLLAVSVVWPDPSTSLGAEGEATAAYLAGLLKDKGVRVTRIAMGVPLGAELEYVDEATLRRAVENRREA